MDGGDPDTLLAYYMFVNHGWRPRQVDDLPDREKFLMVHFALKEAHRKKTLMNEIKAKGR